MRAWIGYALLSGAIVLAGGLMAVAVLGGGAARAVAWAGGLAWGVQLVAFAALVRVRSRHDVGLWVALGVGMLMRLGVVLVAALWLVGRKALDPAVTLLGLVAFLFVLLILESAFIRVGMRNR